MNRVAITNLAAARSRPPEPEHRRTHQKVRRQSRPAGGQWEREWSGRISWNERGRILLAARMLDERTKKPGDRTGALGLEGLKVLELALNMLHKHGRFDMAYDTIAEVTRMARSCVATVLKRLKAAGFLDWTRRFVTTGEPGRRGPQCEQTSNLYKVSLPPEAAKLVEKKKRREPLPANAPPPADAACHEDARAAAAAQYRAMDEADRREAAAASLDAAIDRGRTRAAARNAAGAAGANASPTTGLNP
jgi:hypothetical protein